MTRRITRRTALKAAIGFSAPFVLRHHAYAFPSETVRHASFGGGGQAWSDIGSLTAHRGLHLVAVADVDTSRHARIRQRFPEAHLYQDWRELLDRERDLQSANISTPDHMHGTITMRAMQRGLNVYTQKPLTQTIHEARALARVARERRLVSQMGIQIHSHQVHKTVVATVQAGTIGRVREVHSWSNKTWGDRNPRPDRTDPVPATLDWNKWLGVAAERPFLGGEYYHPANWRKRLDFGTGTFGDMGCHILDPVFTSLALSSPRTVRSTGGSANADNWGLDSHVTYVFPQTMHTTETLTLHWYDGTAKPPAEMRQRIGGAAFSDQGSIYVGTDGVLYSPYIDTPRLFPVERFRDHRLPQVAGEDHYRQFVEACLGNGRTSAPFDYSGPLTESVLLGCLSTRFHDTTLAFDSANLRFTDNDAATRLVRRAPRTGWETEGL
ncbi:MAG TPA: Gfo/Idh/MocA family oxidoreductase [Gemmataceae bacterium]|jgi:predicted dehydrogenase|nr:Gfo/Idh/MocA family oxidoreductase [Gemmataceae bacterium]